MSMQLPQRGPAHDQLAVFLGDWRAEGTSYGRPSQGDEQWASTHTGRWHTGAFFLIQDEKAVVGSAPFETLSVMGVDDSGACYAQAYDNNGFTRRYQVTADADTWRISGPTERATIVFSDDRRTQTITWEWKPGDAWVPLCDRVATRLG